jgi:membrane protease subunit HflK
MSWNEPGGDDKDPWSGRGNSNNSPPDLDEVIRSVKEKLAGFLGGGSNGNGDRTPSNTGDAMKGMGLLAAGALLLWGVTGFYSVTEGNLGVITRFGQFTTITESGLNWHYPAPIESVEIVNVKQQRFIEIGYRGVSGVEQAASSVPKEALMLTADENIIDVRLAVQYQVSDAKAFLFNLANPTSTLKQVTESVQRGVVGSSTMDFVLTKGRSEVAAKIKEEIQSVMDSYQAGILVIGVNLQDAQPPKDVQDAFMDAVKANGDKERLINEAQAYFNDVVPKARGAAARKIQEAEGYKEQVIAQATCETSRFSQLLTEYIKAPEIMRKRIYIESMESVLSEANTAMINLKEGTSNMLYLPLDKMVQQTPVTNNTPPVAEPTPKPVVEEAPAGFNRASARGRDTRGRGNVE